MSSGKYQATPPTLNDQQTYWPQLDINGNLKVAPSVYGLTGAQSVLTGFANSIPMSRYSLTPYSLSSGVLAELQSDETGALLTNSGVLGGVMLQTSVSVVVGGGDVYPANPYRKYLSIQNQDGANPIWVSFNDGVAATATSSFYKIPAGAEKEFGPGSYVPTGRINAISTGGTVNAHIMEGN